MRVIVLVGKGLIVEDPLSRGDGGTAGVGVEEVGRDRDDGMLLDIEGAGVGMAGCNRKW